MKKTWVGLGLLAGVLGTSCTLQSGTIDRTASSQETAISINGKASMTIILDNTSESIDTKTIYLDTYVVTQVILELMASNGTLVSTNWTTNSSTVITFLNVSYGSNTLFVTEIDAFGASNSYSSGINVQRGYHYRVTVPIGGNLVMNLETNS